MTSAFSEQHDSPKTRLTSDNQGRESLISTIRSDLQKYRINNVDEGQNSTFVAITSHAQTEDNLNQMKFLKENLLFKAAQDNDVTKIKELLEEGKAKLDARGVLKEIPLHIAMLFNNTEASVALIAAGPDTVNLFYENDIYRGEVSLHIAIVNRNWTLIQELVDNNADVVNPRATGTFFSPGENTCYYGEYPLSFAVCTGQLEVVRFLHGMGAPLDAQDSYGNTALHMCVFMKNKEKAKLMYDCILKLAEAANPPIVGLQQIKNNNDLTPIELATDSANCEMLQYMLTLRREVHWTYGPITSAVYDLEQIDTWTTDHGSILDALLNSQSQEVKNLVDVTPLKQVLLVKWQSIQRWFYIWFVFMVIHMIIFSVVMHLTPNLKNIQANLTANNAQSQWGFMSGMYKEPGDFARLAAEIFLIICVIVFTIVEAWDISIIGFHKYWVASASIAFHALTWVYIITFIIGVILRLCGNYHEVILFSIAGLSGWLFIVFFTRGFFLTGQFAVMIQKMIVGDLFRFMCIFFIILVAFSTSFAIIYSKLDTIPVQFDSFQVTLFNLFKCMIGIESYETDVFTNFEYSWLIIILFVAYLLLAYVLLINLLIAMMGDTYSRVAEDSEKLWRLQVAEMTLLIERRLPYRIRPRTGTCGADFGFPENKWYIRVEEYSSSYDYVEVNNETFTPFRESRRQNGTDKSVKKDKKGRLGEMLTPIENLY